MKIERGLVIADPWIEHILKGRKDWEMRSRPTAMRGWFGLIRKGSGMVVGLARLVDCGKAMDQAEMIDSIPHHRIPEDMIRRGEVAKWIVPWKLADIIPLDRPVLYQHNSGAVTWVTFTPEVSRRLEEYRDCDGATTASSVSSPTRIVEEAAMQPLARAPEGISPNSPFPKAKPVGALGGNNDRILGRSRLSGGNIRNNHINLSRLLDAFPQDVIGGRNKTDTATRQVLIDWGGPEQAMTDIDGSKSIFRSRGWVRRFFAASDAREGDVVVIAESAPYRISVRLERTMPEEGRDFG